MGREMRISIRPLASRDLDAAAEFGDMQEPGLGPEIYAFLESEIDSLMDTAGLHPQRNGLYCHVVRHRFPYFCIYYTLNDQELQIRAVLDGRRNPRKNQRNLKDC